MAETSRSRVTITLGRSGQVVKRVVDSEPLPPAVGTKRSVRDRLGDTVDLHNKRCCTSFSICFLMHIHTTFST
ncbi:hypothetical protein Hanom_Chr17g01586001 [Helianthus anomalus]